jgi:ABC-type lipoprotein export system ATPase subunit
MKFDVRIDVTTNNIKEIHGLVMEYKDAVKINETGLIVTHSVEAASYGNKILLLKDGEIEKEELSA